MAAGCYVDDARPREERGIKEDSILVEVVIGIVRTLRRIPNAGLEMKRWHARATQARSCGCCRPLRSLQASSTRALQSPRTAWRKSMRPTQRATMITGRRRICCCRSAEWVVKEKPQGRAVGRLSAAESEAIEDATGLLLLLRGRQDWLRRRGRARLHTLQTGRGEH
jgi:hypothetical protein